MTLLYNSICWLPSWAGQVWKYRDILPENGFLWKCGSSRSFSMCVLLRYRLWMCRLCGRGASAMMLFGALILVLADMHIVVVFVLCHDRLIYMNITVVFWTPNSGSSLRRSHNCWTFGVHLASNALLCKIGRMRLCVCVTSQLIGCIWL
jgi:hypothetical protein